MRIIKVFFYKILLTFYLEKKNFHFLIAGKNIRGWVIAMHFEALQRIIQIKLILFKQLVFFFFLNIKE